MSITTNMVKEVKHEYIRVYQRLQRKMEHE